MSAITAPVAATGYAVPKFAWSAISMMVGNAADNSAQLSDTQQISRNPGNLMTRKIWLPKSLYNLLPFFYIFAGLAALLATVYISNWFWVLPHYLLFAAACLHLGVLIYRRRHRRKT